MRDRNAYASLREGLVGAWIPSVSGSGLLLPDLSGNGNNGTLTNMGPEDWVSSQYGRALDFDGSNDYANIENEKGLQSLSNGKMSIGCFFKYTSASAPAVSLRIASKRKTLLPSHGWIFARTSENKIVFAVVNTGGVSQSFSEAISDTQWHSAFAVWDNAAGTAEMFIDGELSTTSQISAIGTADDSAGTLKLGSSFNLTAGQFFNGQLDDIRIYNRALSEPEIKLLASRPGIGLRPQRRTMYYAPPTGARRRRILTSMP